MDLEQIELGFDYPTLFCSEFLKCLLRGPIAKFLPLKRHLTTFSADVLHMIWILSWLGRCAMLDGFVCLFGITYKPANQDLVHTGARDPGYPASPRRNLPQARQPTTVDPVS
jgi:hypothetical protein